VDPATLQFLYDQAPTAALALAILWLFIAGKLHSDAELKALRKDLDTERAAHEQTRAALATASARADAGVRAAELVASAVEGARRGPVP
jgi:citrate synthase